MRAPIRPFPGINFGFDNTIGLLNETLSTRGARSAIDDLNAVLGYERKADFFGLAAIIALQDFKNTENRNPVMYASGYRRRLFVFHYEEHMEFTKVVFHMADPNIAPIRC